jgi:conjugal transfer mating pair stabilization protein TraG
MITDWNLLTAARTLWQEARGEPLIGQQAVAHVLVNSVKDGRWGKSLGEACLWHARFSGWFSPRIVDGKTFIDPNFPAACRLPDSDATLQELAQIIITAQTAHDFTGGALFYYALSIPSPGWTLKMRKLGTWGHQIFLTDRPLPAAA